MIKLPMGLKEYDILGKFGGPRESAEYESVILGENIVWSIV